MKLVVHQGPNAGTTYRLVEGRNVAGRAPDCELVLASKRVSRHHCAFHVRADVCVVEDLGSANGILINGHKMPTCRLEEGTHVQVGDILLVFSRAASAPMDDPDSRPTVVSTKSIDELLAEQLDDAFAPENTAPSIPRDDEEVSLSLDAPELRAAGFGPPPGGLGFAEAPASAGSFGDGSFGDGSFGDGSFGGGAGPVVASLGDPPVQEAPFGAAPSFGGAPAGGPTFGGAPAGGAPFGGAPDEPTGPAGAPPTYRGDAPPPLNVPELGGAAFGADEHSAESTATVTRALSAPKPKGRLPWAARLAGALLFAGLLLLCGPVGGVFSLLSSSSSALEEMAIQRGAALAEGLGHRNAKALAERKELDLDLSPIEGDPAVKDALLVDTRGDVLAPADRTKESLKGNPLFAQAIELRETTWGEDGDWVGVIAPVRAAAVAGGPSRSVVGYAYLRYDASGAASAVGRPWLRGVVSLLLVMLAGGGLAAAFWRLAVKPVSQLREETELAIRGHVSQVTVASRWGQLEELAHSINRALDRARGDSPLDDPRVPALVNAYMSPAFLLDEGAGVVACNPLAGRWLGRSVDELVGQAFVDVVPDPAAQDTLRTMIRALSEGQGPTSQPLQVGGHNLTVSVSGEATQGRLRFAVVVIS